MTKVCKLVYRLLKHIVKDNNFNKHYVAQWFSYFADQTLETRFFQAELIISELLLNNKSLIESEH